MTTLTLHTKVIGDTAASIKKVQKQQLTATLGAIALQEIVSTDDCVPFNYNRETKVEWATKCLKDAGGFDWKLFGSIEGIKNPQTGKIEIWDGLGRLCMAQLAGVQDIPVIIHLDGSPGALFVKKQKLRNRSLNQEEFFVAAASSYTSLGTVDDKKVDAMLKRDLHLLEVVGMRIESGGNYFPKISDISKYPTVKVSTLRRSFNTANGDIGALKAARNLIVHAYPNTDYIAKELFEGIVFMFMAIPDARKNGTYRALCRFLASLNGIPQQSLPFKQIGGNQHNDEARSVALGMASMFRTSDYSKGNPKNVLRESLIKEFKRSVIEEE